MPDLKVLFYSQLTAEDVKTLPDADVLVVDCFGLLSSMYKYGQIAYVGGGFGVGIHNLLEAAVWDVPVIFGPNNQKFQEAQDLKACGGGIEIKDYSDFENAMQRFADSTQLSNAGTEAGRYVLSLTGATQRIFSYVKL
jgi:3-deoxy-D-manno-octulosonic-acid transferase